MIIGARDKKKKQKTFVTDNFSSSPRHKVRKYDVCVCVGILKSLRETISKGVRDVSVFLVECQDDKNKIDLGKTRQLMVRPQLRPKRPNNIGTI